MPNTVRFAHISDVHLPLEGRPPLRYMNLKRTLGWLNWQRKRRYIHTRVALDRIVADIRSQAPDHILVSGDLINIGLPQEYEAARDWLETLGPPDRVSVVPGNHDIYTRGIEVMQGKLTWAPWIANCSYGRAIDPDTPYSLRFPFVRRVGPVAVIGVSSAVARPVGFASGECGKAQLDRLAAQLTRTKADGLVRLVMIHHPPLPGMAPPRRALEDAQELAEVLGRCGAELVIHGHNHTLSSVMHGGIPVLGVASASARRSYGAEPPARYNLLTISRDAARTTIDIETRGLDTPVMQIVQIAAKRFSADSASEAP